MPSPYGRSKSPVSRPVAIPKPLPERKSPTPTASLQKSRAADESVREDSGVTIVKEEPLTYGTAKDKGGSEKDRERRDARDVSAAELNFRSQEHMSAEQLRSLQLQQQLTLQQYYHHHLSQLVYMQGMPIDAKVFQNMQPDQQMQMMQLQRQMMLEQDKHVSNDDYDDDNGDGEDNDGDDDEDEDSDDYYDLMLHFVAIYTFSLNG